MTKVLHVVVANDADNVQAVKAVSGADLWLGFDIYFVAQLPPSNGDFAGYVAEFGSASGLPIDGVFVQNYSGTPKFSTGRTNNGPFAAAATGVWYHVDFRYRPDVPIGTGMFVDNVDQAVTSAFFDTGAIDSVAFGVEFPDSWMTTFEFYIRNITVGSTRGATDAWNGDITAGLGAFTSTHIGAGQTLEVIDDPTPPDVVPPSDPVGGVRISVALNDGPLVEDPTWTYLTDYPNLTAGYDIERLPDEGGNAQVRVYDQDGILDPTNSSGPFYGLIETTLQIQIELYNPTNGNCYSRFRGYIDELAYDVAPFTHQNQAGDTVGVTTLTISCVTIFALLTKIKMFPGEFGVTPPVGSEGTVYFDPVDVDVRILEVLDNAGITSGFYVVFTGNVTVYEGVYSPGQSPLDPIQEAAESEFPDLAIIYADRFGRFVFHGRLAKFDPAGTASDAGPDAWDFTHWKAGDGKAVALSPSDTSQIRTFAFTRGWSRIINEANAMSKGIAETDIPGQLVKDTVSMGLRGICPWDKQELLTRSGLLTGNNANDECKLFATFQVANNAEPRNWITEISFKSVHPSRVGAAANWDQLCRADISDLIDVTMSHPGGGGFNAEPHFIDGIHETAEPLNGEYAMVVQNLTLSPRALFDNPAGLDGV